MFERILVPLDGSDRAEQAIPVAARIARTSGGSIVFVRVVLPPVEFGTYAADGTVALEPGVFERQFTEATDYLAGLVTTYARELADVKVVTEAITGAVSPTIYTVARLEHVDLVIICSHAATGLKRWMFGSVAQEAVRRSPVPVLVLHENGMLPVASETIHPLRTLVALDGSALAETALEPAVELASVLAPSAQAALHLLRVIDLPSVEGKIRNPIAIEYDAIIRKDARHEAEIYLKEVTDRLRERLADVKVTITSSHVISTDIAGTIIKQAEQEDGYSLIAVTTHGRSGLRRLMMGSVTEHILRNTNLPLLVVRPHKGSAQVQRGAELEQERVRWIQNCDESGSNSWGNTKGAKKCWSTF
jgi:nucleotide-binding universal stress UspA family protein